MYGRQVYFVQECSHLRIVYPEDEIRAVDDSAHSKVNSAVPLPTAQTVSCLSSSFLRPLRSLLYPAGDDLSGLTPAACAHTERELVVCPHPSHLNGEDEPLDYRPESQNRREKIHDLNPHL